MNNSRSTTTIIAIVAVVLGCCCLVLISGLAGMVYFVTPISSNAVADVATVFFDATPYAPATFTPTAAPTVVLTPPPTPASADGQTTYERIADAVVPPADPRETVERLLGAPDIPEVVSDTPANHEVGTVLSFWASNVDTDENFEIDAELIYRSENIYFFSELGLNPNANDVKVLVDDFEERGLTTNRAFFGNEWSPGIDGDPRIYVLYARNLGNTVSAYFSSIDSFATEVHEYSNEKEMFYVNADNNFDLDPQQVGGTLTHEFQHMIHWHQDNNEPAWVNEGMSVFSELLSGYPPGSSDVSFVSDPDLQLNAWSDGTPGSNSYPHYGASFLFISYLYGRYGADFVQAVVAEDGNGLHAIDAVLTALGADETTIDVFADWVIANYLDEDDGVFSYPAYPDAPKVGRAGESVTDCNDLPTQQRTVHQYAADYIAIICPPGSYTLTFTGSQQALLTPAQPTDGPTAFWSNRQDDSDTHLTRAFDLSDLDSATLRYDAWWQIETNWDYAYVLVSSDGGDSWTFLRTPVGTDSNPNGNNLGWGYNGESGGSEAVWVTEEVDLTPYVGGEVLIRFEYVTDAAVNRPGLLVDNVSIPELGYSADFERDDDGWTAAGFVRSDNILPQSFVVQVIRDDGATVERVPLAADNTATIALNGDEIVVVSGTTLFTTEKASYAFSISTPN